MADSNSTTTTPATENRDPSEILERKICHARNLALCLQDSEGTPAPERECLDLMRELLDDASNALSALLAQKGGVA